MTPKRILILMLICTAVLSSVQTYLDSKGIVEPVSIQVGSTIGFSFLVFAWYWADSQARSFRRSPFLSVGIAAFAVIAVPYYLVRSRARGERLKAIGKLIGFVGLMVLALIIGVFPGAWLS